MIEDAASIPIYDYNEIIQLMMSGKHRCFPGRSFITFSVTDNHKGAKFLVITLCRECMSCANAHSMPQRSCDCFNSWNAWVWIKTKYAIFFRKLSQFFLWHITQVRKDRIKNHSCMPLTNKNPIAILCTR